MKFGVRIPASRYVASCGVLDIKIFEVIPTKLTRQ